MKKHIIENNSKYIIFNPETAKITVQSDRPKEMVCYDELTENLGQSKKSEVTARTIFISMTETCNLACKYCYAEHGTYGRINKIAIDVKEFLKVYEKLNPEKKCLDTLVFFGGEPLLALDNIREIAYNTKQIYDKKIQYSIITNGTLLSQEAIELFNQYAFAVTISLDGPKKYNDLMRVMKNGQSCYDTIQNNLKQIKNRKFKLTAEVTLSPAFFENYESGTIKEFINVFKKMSFDSFQVAPADYKEAYNETIFEKMRLFYSDLVKEVFDKIESNEEMGPEFYEVFRYVMNIVKNKRYKACAAGTAHIFVSSKCEVYPCQFYYKCGKKEMHEKENYSISEGIRKSDIVECHNCFCYYLCENWCPGASLCQNGSEQALIQSRCIATKSMVEACITNLAEVYSTETRWEKFVDNLKGLVKKCEA